MDPRVIASAARAGTIIESALSLLRPPRRRSGEKELRVILYRSLSDSQRMSVRGRVVGMVETRKRKLRRSGAVSAREHLVALYRAFDADDIPGARVVVSCEGRDTIVEADQGGYFLADLDTPSGSRWAAGSHTVEARLCVETTTNGSASSRFGSVTSTAYVPGNEATMLIISDLDDTAMDTQTPHTPRMLRTVLLRSARLRHPIAGVPSLYRRLRDGASGNARNSLCYISSGAWNLYDNVVDYLDEHDLPAGPILLNDWGSRQRGFHAVSHSHKAVHVSALANRYPGVGMLLIGDDVHEDPDLYFRAATSHPGRVRAIWIRLVRNESARINRIELLRARLEEVGTDLVLSDNTEVFERHARKRGWIAG